ncbi:MAG: hypothetical protein V4629_00420 [Pseudomonadota bacterium]
MKFFTIFLTFFLLSACGTYQTTVQSEAVTYLQLTGDVNGKQLTLDDNAPIDLSTLKSFNENGKKVTKVQVKPGTHRVTITSQDILEIDRQIYVSEGNSFEILMP